MGEVQHVEHKAKESQRAPQRAGGVAAPLAHRSLIALQRTAGNAAVSEWLRQRTSAHTTVGPQRVIETEGPTSVMPNPVPPKPLVFPDDPRQEEQRAMAAEARRIFNEVLVTTGMPPKWELLLRDPKFAAVVEAEAERIRREDSLIITARRAEEQSKLDQIEAENARKPQPETSANNAAAGKLERAKSRFDKLSEAVANGEKHLLEVVPKPIFEKIMGFLDTKARLTLRTASSGLRGEVREYHQARAPYKDKETFVSATSGHFPLVFAKGEYTQNEVNLKDNLALAWTEYNKYKGDAKLPAFIERMDDNRYIFHPDRMLPETRKLLEETGRLFCPSRGKWSPQMNDAWLLRLLHEGVPIVLLSRPELEALWDLQEQRPTVTGRELLLLLQSGHRATPGQGNTAPFGSGGLVMTPPSGVGPANIHNAEPADARKTLEQFSQTHSPSFTEPVTEHASQGPRYAAITKASTEQIYRQEQITGIKNKIKKFLNFAFLMENAAKAERDAGRNQAKTARMKLDKENAAAKMELELKELNKLIQVLKLSESEMNELRQAVDTLQTAQEGAKNVGRLDEHKKRIFRYQ